MSQDSTKLHGAFSWNELVTSDPEAAKAFYSELLGWTLSEMEGGEVPYTIAKAGETEVAGIMPIPPDAGNMPPHWGAYVTVDDVDASAGRAESLGGKICMPPTDIPGIGRFSVISDPQGAILALITYAADYK